MMKNDNKFIKSFDLTVLILYLGLYVFSILDVFIFKFHIKITFQNPIPLSIFYIYFLVSITNTIKYLTTFKEKREINQNEKLKKFIIEFNFTLSAVIVLIGLKFLSQNFFYSNLLIITIPFFILLIMFRMSISIFSIALDVSKTSIFILLFLLACFTIVLGVFNIQWWALISSLLIVWNFINSKEFLELKLKGKSKINISKRQNYIWKRNKIFAYALTTILYLNLLISQIFESSNQMFISRGLLRITIFTSLLIGILFVYLFSLLINKYKIFRNSKNSFINYFFNKNIDFHYGKIMNDLDETKMNSRRKYRKLL